MIKKLTAIVSLVLLTGTLFILPVCAAEGTLPASNLTERQDEQMVQDAMTALATAYQQKDLRGFMKLVSPDFVGDDFLLYRAVRRDFRFFDDISLRLSIDGFAIDNKGRFQVTVKYNRTVIANNNSRSYKDSGVTMLTFYPDAGQVKLYDMKFPMLFGLSEGLQVTSGVVNEAETVNVMVVDRSGNVSVEPFGDALDAANGTSVIRGMVHLASSRDIIQGFSFADNSRVNGTPLQGDLGWSASGPGILTLKYGTRYMKITSAGGLGSLTQAPDPATYSTAGRDPIIVRTGDIYALKLSGSNKFALIEIVSIDSPTAGSIGGAIRYEYQPSGSRFF